jgi:hypothetical protein
LFPAWTKRLFAALASAVALGATIIFLLAPSANVMSPVIADPPEQVSNPVIVVAGVITTEVALVAPIARAAAAERSTPPLA